MNEKFSDFLILEMYNADTTWSTLSFFKYYLRSKHFEKVFEIGDSPVGKKLRHSYSKIDRNAIHNSEDCLIIFRFCQLENSDEIAFCDIFYVNLSSKRLLFQQEIELRYEESYYRRAIYLQFLWKDEHKIVMRFGGKTILVMNRAKRAISLHRIPADIDPKGNYDQFVTLIPKEKISKEKILKEEMLLPSKAFKIFDFDKFFLIYSEVGLSDFRIDEFGKIKDYAILSSLTYKGHERKFISYPFNRMK